MKKVKFLIISLLASLATFATAANEADQLNVFIKAVPGSQKVSVSLQGLRGETVIRLMDQNEVLLLQQATTEPTFGKVLDLSGLKEGKYEIQISTENKEIVQPVMLEGTSVKVPSEWREVYFSPVVRVEGSTVDLSWFNGKIADMKVRISDLNGSIIYSEDINNVVKVEKRYNLSKVEHGDYIITINTPRRTYYENVTIK